MGTQSCLTRRCASQTRRVAAACVVAFGTLAAAGVAAVFLAVRGRGPTWPGRTHLTATASAPPREHTQGDRAIRCSPPTAHQRPAIGPRRRPQQHDFPPGRAETTKTTPCTRRKDEIEIGLRGSPGNRRFRRRRAECRRHAARHAVCARQCISRGDDTGRLLEHRSPVRDRPADRWPGELR